VSPDICVGFLVGPPLGMDALSEFLRSLEDHPAGEPHRLLALVNGLDREQEPASSVPVPVEGPAHEVLWLEENRIDLAVYRDVAEGIGEPYVCFMNSYCRPLADGWLRTMAAHARREDVGIVGTTGSYESFYSAARWPLRLRHRGGFPPFPNPHVRTNGFMLRRSLMRELDWGPVRRKRDAWRLESGYGSVTRQVHARGLRAVVVGRDGNAYDSDRWYESRTFRSGEQENLLVEDNRTRQFAEADPKTRQMLAERAWGRGR
jgi:hypothetical protein